MASDPNVPINHPGGPTFTQRLWSEEVAIARAEAGELGSNRDPSYEFGNGRRFVEPLNRVWDEGNVAPVSTISPVISGTSTVGSVLTVSAGSWSGVPDPALTYQWLRDAGVIAGQTAMTYTVVAGDVTKTITCRETATNIAGSASASSNGIAIPAVIPVNTVAPVVSGLAEVGATLTATTGTWTGYPTPTYTYQWMLGISTIVGETNSTYVVLSNDQGEDITCVVTATNAAGSASATSNIVSIPAAYPPIDLFANSEVGACFDPSDLTTMFQDRAGTTPVTADGQTVGLILDKSKGLVLGSELVTNGDFNIDANWSKGAGCTISGGAAVFTAATGFFSQNLGIGNVVGYYEYTVVVDSITSGVLSLETDGGIGNEFSITAPGTYVFRRNNLGVGPMLYLNSKVDPLTAVVSSVSLKKVAGNHATAPSDAARPLYKTDGTYHWLQFDGVDDSLSTAEIDFTGTDKMSVFSGVKKNNDTASIVVELSISIINSGSFYLVTGTDLGGTGYTSMSKGSAAASDPLASKAFTFTAPDTAVLASTHDIGGDISTLRRNGTAGTNGTGDKGTGNFGNYPIYIGSRNNLTLPINGNIYSLIVRGALSTADEITNTETWVNSKTGAY